MSELTRRSFVRSSAGAAAGMAAVGAFGVADADAKQRATHDKPIVAWIANPRDGKITIMSGDEQVVIHDHALAAKIAHAAKPATKKHTAKHTAKHTVKK